MNDLFTAWTAVWNGDLARAEQIIDPEYRIHAVLPDGDVSHLRGPAGPTGMVTTLHAAFPGLRFTVEVGPIADGDHLVGRWRATGTYGGGAPGAQAPAGTRVTWTGTDVLRVDLVPGSAQAGHR
jgi:hypothetical protein